MHNFFAGPGKLPASVLARIRTELTNFQGTGMSVMEISHRAPPILELIDRVEQRLRRLLHLPSESAVLMMQGGGSLQFCLVPMNLSSPGDMVDYVETGYWAEKATNACRGMGRDVKVVARDYHAIPANIEVRPEARYLHICTNNTVVGTQWHLTPSVNIPIVADMSSDFLSRPQDISAFDLVYAHAQKTIGTAGVTVVILSEQALAKIPNGIPEFFDYRAHVRAKSNYHTPPVFSIYVMDCMLDWLEHEVGGLEAMGRLNQEKAGLLYALLDASDLYRCPASITSRSQMNLVFDIEDTKLAQQFSDKARQHGFVGLDGHRSRGGFRASLYNAVTLDDVRALTSFMKDFERFQG